MQAPARKLRASLAPTQFALIIAGLQAYATSSVPSGESVKPARSSSAALAWLILASA